MCRDPITFRIWGATRSKYLSALQQRALSRSFLSWHSLKYSKVLSSYSSCPFSGSTLLVIELKRLFLLSGNIEFLRNVLSPLTGNWFLAEIWISLSMFWSNSKSAFACYLEFVISANGLFMLVTICWFGCAEPYRFSFITWSSFGSLHLIIFN
jgi:hypothetical protein